MMESGRAWSPLGWGGVHGWPAGALFFTTFGSDPFFLALARSPRAARPRRGVARAACHRRQAGGQPTTAERLLVDHARVSTERSALAIDNGLAVSGLGLNSLALNSLAL